MPLERLGGSLRRLGDEDDSDRKGASAASYNRDHDATMATRRRGGISAGSYDDGGSLLSLVHNSDDIAIDSLGGSRLPSTSPYYEAHYDDNMTLLKLGGVGGVQRSGSWGYARSGAGRATFQNQLSDSPETTDTNDGVAHDDECDTAEQTSRREPSTSQGSYSDVPSSSSRTSTSTSSSSAAAFSLRSLSNRNSASSTGSSSASSSVRRRTPDDLDASAITTESEGTDSVTTAPGTRHASISTATGSSSSLATETEHVQGRSPPDTFQMQRIQSIGRGYDVRKQRGSTEEEQDDAASTTTVEPRTPSAATRDDDPDDTIIPLTRSPRKSARNLDSGDYRMPLTSSPKLSSLPTLKNRIDALSLTAAAQASPQDNVQEAPGFVPPEPRRHTGSYALRSRSALSQQLGGNLNFGNGQGRAAARKELARFTAADPALPTTELMPDARVATFYGSPAMPKDEDMPEAQASGSRPPMARSSTSAANINVLRTPTTEEWSRYLVKQGFDPLLIATATGLTGSGGGVANRTTRSRSNTGRSVPAGKRRISDRETSKVASFETPYERSQLADLSASAGDVMPAPRARPSLSSSIRGVAEDLTSLDEEGQHDLDIDEYDDGVDVGGDSDEDDEDETLRKSVEDVGARGSGGVSDDDAGNGYIDERMRALHEMLSRPSSRLGTPAPSESGRGGVRIRSSSDALRMQLETARRGSSRWPTRDTAAILAGYPLPPSGEQRSINDFAIVDDIGRGAYGLVKKARVRDEQTGEPAGPEFCIKYIIKSRILADCWRRHKVLGPIPVEIHVLDQLRRLPYQMPTDPPAWSPEKLFGAYAPPPTPKTAVAALSDESMEGDVTVGHPSLCTMVDFFEDHEFYYMVMPCFGTGQDLFDYVESQPHGLTTKQVRCILGQLADGLRFLHSNNVVHRDVKDENVILDGKGHIQLIDFGSAAHINARIGSRLFDTFSGTLDYAAAEILRGEKYGGKEQDVWALGVVTYVLLCGDCPFWNGEEAMEGLREGTRAHSVLIERCNAAAMAAEGTSDEAVLSTGSLGRPNASAIRDAVAFGLDGFTGEPIQNTLRSTAPTSDADFVRRQRDFVGQQDGGGRLHDAADLIFRCVDLDLTARPTMDQICHHRFLLGSAGWHGHMGWQSMTSSSSSSSSLD